jgi:hypothetical protein
MGLVVDAIMYKVKAPDPLEDITEMQRAKFMTNGGEVMKDLLTAAKRTTDRYHQGVDLAGRER